MLYFVRRVFLRPHLETWCAVKKVPFLRINNFIHYELSTLTKIKLPDFFSISDAIYFEERQYRITSYVFIIKKIVVFLTFCCSTYYVLTQTTTLCSQQLVLTSSFYSYITLYYKKIFIIH